MPELTSSPTQALLWDVWARNRKAICFVAGITVVVGLLNRFAPGAYRSAETNHVAAGIPLILAIFNETSAIATLLVAFAILGYTEFNSQKSSIGFPHRLFTLPITSVRLVAGPMLLSLASIELFYWVWMRLVLQRDGSILAGAVLMGSYMVVYQTILWTLGRTGPLRLLVLAVVAMMFFAAWLAPTFPNPIFSEASLLMLFAGLGLVTFFIAWICIARQRSGGGGRVWLSATTLLQSPARRMSARLPGRRRDFSSAAAAQFWFDWRRSGTVLPRLVGGLLCFVFVPMSWNSRDHPGATLLLLLTTLATPIILSAPVGKAFSKPDLWSGELSVPPVVAVRPIATVDLVAIKVRVAAASAALSWFLVLAFLSVWLPFWASPKALTTIRDAVSRIYGHSAVPQALIVALLIAMSIFLTWRFLITSLWLGFSGSNKVFALTAVPYVFVPFVALAFLLSLSKNHESIFGWMQQNLPRLVPSLEWIAVLLLMAKLCTAAWSWHEIGRERVRRYLPYWIGIASCLIATAAVLSTGLRQITLSDVSGLRNLLFLIALLLVPAGRLGIATLSLARNRHRR